MGFKSHLDHEHQVIEKAAAQLSPLLKKETRTEQELQRALDLLDFFSKYVIDLHFSKEEKILFPEVRKLVIDQLGGPKCGDFFGKYELHKDAEVLTQLGKDLSLPSYTFSPKLIQLLDGRWSGLRIPLSEHEALHYGVRLIQNSLQASPLPDNFTFRKLVRIFFRLLTDHHEKEDTCLLVAFEKAASTQLQTDMTERAILLNQEFGLHRIQKLESRV